MVDEREGGREGRRGADAWVSVCKLRKGGREGGREGDGTQAINDLFI